MVRQGTTFGKIERYEENLPVIIDASMREFVRSE